MADTIACGEIARIEGEAASPYCGTTVSVRKASMEDIPALLRLVNGYAAQGIMLPRTEFEISENIRDFSIFLSETSLVGCAALHFYTPSMGEIRSLAVDPKWKQRGAGARLVAALEAEAREFGLDAVFAFTYIPGFFRKLGFVEIERGALPLKAWKDCLRCPKFQCCDEIAVIKTLRGEGKGVLDTHIVGYRTPSISGGEASPALPVITTPH